MIKFKIFISLIFFIVNINYINCDIITFNNTYGISNCIFINQPCQLNSSVVWNNGIIPKDGDSIVIDFSKIENKNNGSFYLLGNFKNITLDSFHIYGVNSNSSSNSSSIIGGCCSNNNDDNASIIKTNLIISESNIIILNDCYIEFTNITINQTSNSDSFNNANEIFISDLSIYQSKVIIDGSSSVITNSTLFNSTIDALDVTLLSESSFTNNNDATISAIFNHQSNGLLRFLGITWIEKSLFSNGIIDFDNQVMISSTSTLNTIQISGEINISKGKTVTINDILSIEQSKLLITVTEESTLYISGMINGGLTLMGEVLLIDNSQLVVPSGYLLSLPSSYIYNGTVTTEDSKESLTILNTHQESLNIVSPGSINILGSTLGQVQIESMDEQLVIQTTSAIGQLINQGSLVIETDSSLVIYNESISNGDIQVEGFLTLSNLLNSSINGGNGGIFVNSSGSLFIYDNINSPIKSLSLVEIKSSSIILTQSIEIDSIDGTLSIDEPGCIIESNLTMTQSTTLKLLSASLNSTELPLLKIEGVLYLDQVKLYIEFNQNNIQPTSNDKILLIQSNNIYSNINFINVNNQDIIISNLISNGNIGYKITKPDDQGNIYIEFFNDISNQTPKWEIIVIVFAVVGPIVLIVLFVLICCYMVKRNQNKQSTNNRNNYTNNIISRRRRRRQYPSAESERLIK